MEVLSCNVCYFCIQINLKEKAGDNPHSAFRASNLIAALDLCDSWEARLAEDTEEMRDMME